MSLHAVENVDDAFRATKAFLLPFDRRRWLKLAVVVFFVGGSSLPTSQFESSGTVDADFDVVPDQRRAIRSGDGDEVASPT